MDYIAKETAGDRIVLLSRPLALPGCCAVCGYVGTNAGDAGDIRVFIDFQLDLEFYGRVYWCSACLLQAANALSWVSVDQAEALRTNITSQESELIVLREQNERLRSSLASLLGSPNDSSVSLLLDGPEIQRQGDESIEESTTGGEFTQPALDEPVSVERSDGVSSTSSRVESNEFTL